MLLADHKRIAYIPHIEYRLIQELFKLSFEGLCYCYYKEYFDSINNKFTTPHVYDWYCYTVNGYYDLAIGHWRMIFGSSSEPTHYNKLLDSQLLKVKLENLEISSPATTDKLKQWLLKEVELTEKEFKQYHLKTQKYRNKNLIHRENLPKIKDGDLEYPLIVPAEKSFLSFIVILIKLAKTFPIIPDAVNKYELIYPDLIEKSEITDLIKKSIPIFLDKVNI